MFSDGFEENESLRVVIKAIEPESMRIILDFVYTGGKEIKIEEDNVQSLFQASNLLQFSDIKLLCAEFLLKHLETSNCLQFLELAEMHDCQNMFKSVDKFIGKHFNEISKLHAASVGKETMIKLLKNEEIFTSEIEVFNALKMWVEINPKERKEHLPELLELVRLKVISRRMLNSSVLPYLEKFPQCQDYLFKVMRYHLLDIEQKKSHQFNNLLARKGQEKVLLFIDKDFCYEYDFEENKVFKQMQLPKQDADIYYNGQDLFSISVNDDSIDIVWKWNLLKKTWEEISNGPIDADSNVIYMDFELIGSKIFALGVAEEGQTHKVSMIDTKHSELGWTRLASMVQSRRSESLLCMLNHGGVPYVFDLGKKYYEWYDEELNQWTIVKPDNWLLKVESVLVSHDDLIYSTNEEDKEFYSFDPSTKTCKRLANCLIDPFYHYLLSTGDSLIKIHCNHGEMEIYDVEDKTWKRIETAITKGIGLSRPFIVNKSVLGKGQEYGESE